MSTLGCYVEQNPKFIPVSGKTNSFNYSMARGLGGDFMPFNSSSLSD